MQKIKRLEKCYREALDYDLDHGQKILAMDHGQKKFNVNYININIDTNYPELNHS